MYVTVDRRHPQALTLALDLIYASSSRVNLSIFLVVSTNVLFLLGAGLFSKAVGDFERYFFGKAVGGDVGELATGPGSYDTRGSVWSLSYGTSPSSARLHRS
jgi:high-affinity iron transporter